MGTDISRINFDAKKHYTSVRMQQGRVLTDDDYNEDNRIHEDEYRKSNIDIIGPYGSPDAGFSIAAPRIETGLINFDILAGVVYLGGLRLLLEQKETYNAQSDWLQHSPNDDSIPPVADKPRYDLVFIEAWQQAVTAVEDESLFEVALGGPDTTTRLKNMRRVMIAPGIGTCDCADAWDELTGQWEKAQLGLINQAYERVTDEVLKVSFTDAGLADDLCTPTAAGGYLGAENQAIRVQLTDPKNFTWGFDNASPLYRVTVSEGGTKIHIITEVKDQYHWPLSGQTVEILPWSAILPNGEKVAEQMGHLSLVDASYNPDSGEFTLQSPVPAGFGTSWLNGGRPADYFYLRVWNRGNDLSSPEKIPFTTGVPVALGHTGIEITFTGTQMVAGDFWVIAARPETPTLVVPWGLETGIPPHGVHRYFAPLAVIRWTIGPNGVITGEVVHDCRKKFNPLTEQECCCTFSVGDGIRSKGDFNSIQEAVNSLPAAGGKICVLPGEHVANVIIKDRQQVRISGCGDQSIVRPGPNQPSIPIFQIQNSQKIQIDQLTLFALDGIGVAVSDTEDVKTASEKITIDHNNILAGINAIKIQTQPVARGNNSIDILYNQIGMIDKSIGGPAIFSIADDVLIERNRIVVVPAPDPKNPDDPRDPDDPNGGNPFDPCADATLTYKRGFSIKYQVYLLLRFVFIYLPTGRYQKGYAAQGGIQIGNTSERVTIRANEIIGGAGNGITLGHIVEVIILSANFNNSISNAAATKLTFAVNNQLYSYSGLYEIIIEDNLILQMGLNGISAVQAFGEEQHVVHIEDLTIYRNTIRNCARFIPAEIPASALRYVAFGGVVLSDTEDGKIQENRIENNGLNAGNPTCGVFVLYGERMDISTNSITSNGTVVALRQAANRAGARGGIVIKMAFKAPDTKNSFGTSTNAAGAALLAATPSFDGVPAVKIHNNIVNQPLGHALFLNAFGPVSVVGNQFTSLGTDRLNPQSILASAVYILNLGVSKDLLVIGFRNLANANPAAFAQLLTNHAYAQILRAMQYLPNGKVMFTDNQTTLDMRTATNNIGLSAQLVASLDDVAFNNNQSECAGFISLVQGNVSVDVVLLNTILFAVSVRANDNRFQDGLTLTLYSLLSYGYMNTATGNQASHCLLTLGTLRSINSNIILTNNLCDNVKQSLGSAWAVPAGKDF